MKIGSVKREQIVNILKGMVKNKVFLTSASLHYEFFDIGSKELNRFKQGLESYITYEITQTPTEIWAAIYVRGVDEQFRVELNKDLAMIKFVE